jgi:hypothetical protein
LILHPWTFHTLGNRRISDNLSVTKTTLPRTFSMSDCVITILMKLLQNIHRITPINRCEYKNHPIYFHPYNDIHVIVTVFLFRRVVVRCNYVQHQLFQMYI